MKEKQRVERTKRAKDINKVLKRLYADIRIMLNHSNAWELLVATQLSAQCTDARVNMITTDLFKKYKTIKAYANAPQKEMEKMVYQCGFYKNKAKNIRNAAKMVLEKFGGEVPHTMEELVELPGVARKTANVILSNWFGLHEGIAVDTHVRRFSIRFDLSSHTDPVRIERDLIAIVPKKDWWGFNHRLVQYGRDYCPARKHDCANHPLTKIYPKAADIWPKSK